MADKWADKLISAVQYNDENTHIVKVRVHDDLGSTVGLGTSQTRESVIAALTALTTYCTIYKSEDGKWQKGATVRRVVIGGTSYIRTDADSTKKDNLGSLPTF